MKFKLFLLFLLVVPMTFGNIYHPNIEVKPYSATFLFTNGYYSDVYIPSEPIRFFLALTFDYDHPLLDSTSNIFVKDYFYGVPEQVIANKLRPEFNLGIKSPNDLRRTAIDEFPYYIKSCHVKCNSDSNSYDYSFYGGKFEFIEGVFRLDRVITMQEHYECSYSVIQETYKQTVYCELGLNDVYIGKGGYADPIEFVRGLRGDGEYTSDVSCREYSLFNPSLSYGCDISISYDLTYTPQVLGNYTPVDRQNSTLRNINETLITAPDNQSITPPTADRTQDSSRAKEIEKQRQYEQQLRLMTQKNSFLNSFITICLILFSLILLSYYLLTIAILGYLISVLVPRIISFPYRAIAGFRNKGEMK